MPKAMTPGVMAEHALGSVRVKAGSEPVTNNTNGTINHNNKFGKDRSVSVGNGDGGGENGERKVKQEKNGGADGGKGDGGADQEDEEEEEILDMSALAPALPQITQGFYPLRVLIGRLLQESHTQLRDLISSLQDAREMDRRIKLIEHVVERRQQFIKLLVLSTWARRAEEVSRVIDLKAWFDSVEHTYITTSHQTFNLRKDLTNAKVPNPDLETAIEVLSTGKAPSVPSYNYIPPPPLTAKQTLKLLRDVNTLLSIRLNIHEKIPEHFRNYRIHDGRVTFWVENEFEADLTIGTDDFSSQLFLIDFRMTFQPAIQDLPAGRFRQELEMMGNEILRTKGLEGLYETLHDFVMTHKILTLRRQAIEMHSGRWTETLYISMLKRTLSIYYWSGRPDVKNWIEVGVMRPRGKEPSRLGVRWHREGKEVKDVTVPINTAVVSAEELIMTVTALHAKWLLTTTRDMLAAHTIFPPSTLTLVTSDRDSFDSYLKVQLTPTKHLTIQIEPVTGRFALQKLSVTTSMAERTINSARPEDKTVIFQQILRVRFMAIQEEIESRAKSLGWEIMKLMTIDPSIIKHWFGNTTRYLTFMRRKSWRKNWLVVVVFGDTGESWWVAELQELPKGWLMPDVQRIPVAGTPNISYQFLDNLEKMASGIISLYVNARALSAAGVQYTLRPSISADPAVRIPDLMVRFDALMKHDWGMNVLKVGFHGLSTHGHANMTVQGRAKEPMTQLHRTKIQASDTDVAFHPQTGGFALRFIVPVGDSIIDAIVERLHRIERLIGFVKVVRRYNLACHHVSLGRIAFTYGRDPKATADISFSGDKDMQLHLPEGSAHNRIKHFLEQQLNDRGLELVVMNLAATQTLLAALEDIEAETPEGDLFITARSAEWYRMEYSRKGHVIDIQLRTKKSRFEWHIRDAALVTASAQPGFPAVGITGFGRMHAQVLQGLWIEGAGKGTTPLKSGLTASLGVVGDIIKKIHALLLPPLGDKMQQQQQQQGQHVGQGGVGQQQPQQQPQQQQQAATATLVLPMSSGPGMAAPGQGWS